MVHKVSTSAARVLKYLDPRVKRQHWASTKQIGFCYKIKAVMDKGID